MSYENFYDKFYVTCCKCGSTDVDLSVDSCEQCGNNIEAECNVCKSVFRYHVFKQINREK